MNIYRYEFVVLCPNNNMSISYKLTIETNRSIMVEDIVEACDVGSVYHEDLAHRLYSKFAGRQTLEAFHHGVWIETRRGHL